MKETSISVTDVARNFADCVNRVHHHNVTFVLLKHGTPVARLIPVGEKLCYGRDLAKVLRKSELSTDEAIAWNRDLRAARKRLKTPVGSFRTHKRIKAEKPR
jgi:antitoxin (DNA-binding transcriptional repressor) of toxin-antitoxin stability system